MSMLPMSTAARPPAQTLREVTRNCDEDQPLSSRDPRWQDLDVMIPDKEARDRLIAASGGAVRDLLELVSQAAFLARGDILELSDIEEALTRRKQRMRDLIQVNGWADTPPRAS